MQEDEDLGIRSDVPLSKRLGSIGPIFLEILDIQALDFIFGILSIVVIVLGLYYYLGFWLSVGVFIALFFVLGGWGWLTNLFLDQWINIVSFGGPVYGKLGGLGRKLFFINLKASDAIEIELDPLDAKKLKDFLQLLINYEQARLKLAYRELVYSPIHGEIDQADFESKWTSIWEDQILELQTDHLKFKDVLKNSNYAYLFASGSILQMTPRMSRLFILFQLASLYLVALLLRDRIQFLFVIQAGVFLSFIFALLWYIAVSFSYNKFFTFVDLDSIPESLREKYWEPLKSLSGILFQPRELRVRSKFYAVMREFQVRLILSGINYSGGALLLVGACFLIARLLNIPELEFWYSSLAVAVLVAPIFLGLGFYLISIILQSSRQVVAPLIAGLLGAALPFVIEFIITGEFKLDLAENAVSSVISGLGILLTTVVTTHIQETVEGKG